MDFVGEGSKHESNFVGINFGSIEVKLRGRVSGNWIILLIQTGGVAESVEKIHTFYFFLNNDLPRFIFQDDHFILEWYETTYLLNGLKQFYVP